MIGVIVPTYNRSSDLRSALSSLGSQTKKNFITIVVDDASTEDIKSVCNEFHNVLNLVYLRSEINQGPGLTRQIGINWAARANIEYLMFLDSDDLLYPNAVARLSYEIQINCADVVASTITVEGDTHGGRFIEADRSITWLHGKIYRTSFLVRNQISFPEELRTNEDLCFNIMVYLMSQQSKTCLYVNEQLYLWRTNSNSMTKNTTIRNQCVGWDFVHAIYYAARYAVEHNSVNETLVSHFISLYNYYETGLARDGKVDPIIEERVRFIVNLPIFIETINNPNKISKYFGCVNPCLVDQKQIFPFQESFYTWTNRFIEKKERQNDGNSSN